ncbi:hypothetical protein [Paludisphaera mucosa]|uniref:YHS domain-containing protein n=1 Tax=Paludisphaera mucosa TaxID=3030827 RepID=A0ABT6F7D8_9BACT|nr:hypothetical protein [Paludisphaera mucosa]MDG3003503.1 hypothetical protein [Paludisphaera mucosa]
MPLGDPAQRIRGWTETHSWAWTFLEGKPTGMSFKMDGSKLLKSGSLTYEAGRKKYVLRTEPVASESSGATSKRSKPVIYEGTIDGKGKLLTLDRTDVSADRPAERLTLRPNGNLVRYTMFVERRASKTGAYVRSTEIGLTKEGETFAAGSTAIERPKCVVTGGAATQTVSFQGRDFPICCSGCRDEFLESPDKYVKKAASAGSSTAAERKPSPPARKGRSDDDAFSNDVGEPKTMP